jgi:hypothetical protein
MTNGTTRALTTAASVRGAEMSTSGQAALEVQSNKSADFGGWPLSWWTQATTGVLRTWGQFSQLGLQPAAGRRFVAATKPATQAPVDVDPPTSGDRLFHATLGRITAGVSPASLGLAYADLAFHFAVSPGKWQQLLERADKQRCWSNHLCRTNLERPRLSALYRAAVARSLPRRRVAALAVQFDLPGVPPEPTIAAPRDDWNRWCV